MIINAKQRLKAASKKYELVEEDTITFKGRPLYRIRALVDFENVPLRVKKGDLGGYIQHEGNLSQKGTCWVTGKSKVCGMAKVYEDALVNDSLIRDNAQVYGKAKVLESEVSGEAQIYGHSLVFFR